MAGDWIKIEHALPDKPEVMEMATTLGIDPDAVVGKLIRVWTWFDNHTSDGNAPVTVRALLNRYTGVTGFVTAMESVGWISESNGSLTVSRFERHNGQTAKERANTNRRVSKSRKCNAPTVTNVTPQPLQKPLPEKRREENSIIEKERETEKHQVRRPTIEQAKSAASTIGITEDKAVEWWNAREASEWMKGMAGGGTSPVGTNWQADMTTYVKRGGYGSGNGNSRTDHRAAKKEGEFKERIKIKEL